MVGNLIGVLFDGIAYGSLLFIISIGLSVTMGLMNFVNLAHGARQRRAVMMPRMERFGNVHGAPSVTARLAEGIAEPPPR